MKHSHEKLYLSLVSAPATRAVYQSDGCIFGLCACYPCSLPERLSYLLRLPPGSCQVDFQNVGVCACHRCSSADWFSDPWSLHLPPVQFTGIFAHNVVMVQYDAAGFVGHVVLSGSHAGLSWDCSLCLAMLFVINLFWCALRLIEQVMRRIPRCQLFSFAKVFLRIWFLQWLVLDINLIRVLHDKTVFLKCSSASKAHWSHDSLHLQPSQSVSECQCVKYRETGH